MILREKQNNVNLKEEATSLLKGKMEGRIEVTGRRGKRRKQLLYDLKGKT
jgi:hypothetical protein